MKKLTKTTFYCSILVLVSLFVSVLCVSPLVQASAEETRYEVGEDAVFSGSEEVFCEYPYDNEAKDFGEGYQITAYGSYAGSLVKFTNEDVKAVSSISEYAQTGVGSFTDEKVAPLFTIYWAEDPNSSMLSTDYCSLAFGPKSFYDGGRGWFVELIFTRDGKVAPILLNSEYVYYEIDGVSYPPTSNGYITEECPRYDVNTFYNGSGVKEYNVFRVYADYEAGKMYFCNGEDASLANGKLFEFDVDWSMYGDEELWTTRFCPFSLYGSTFTYFFKAINGQPIVDAYILNYGRINSKYTLGAELEQPEAECYCYGEFFDCDSYLIFPDQSKVEFESESATLSQAGAYTLVLEYTTEEDVTYYREVSFDVVEKTYITVAAPTVESEGLSVEDGLPVLNGTTQGGIYRWKAGQTATEGKATYVWEFVPTQTDEMVEYSNTSGEIELEFTASASSSTGTGEPTEEGCGSVVALPVMLSLLLVCGVVLFKKQKN